MSLCITDIFFAILASLWVFIIGWPFYLQHLRRKQRSRLKKPLPARPTQDDPRRVVAFFHPLCDAGGGGERVLWTAVKATLDDMPDCVVVIWCWDGVSEGEVLAKVKAQFNIVIPPTALTFYKLKRWRWLEAKRYPRLTLFCQSLFSVAVGLEAMSLFIPDIFVDTVGFAFVYPLVRFFYRCRVLTYVHYPTISTDMLTKVANRTTDFNNSAYIAKSSVLSHAKATYYALFATAYSFSGRYADAVLVNSTWTHNHINTLWAQPEKTTVAYPPCDTSSLSELELEGRELVILSVAQFRPEKKHEVQLRVLRELFDMQPTWTSKVRLVLIGGSRNSSDYDRVQNLRSLASELRIEDQIQFYVNAPHSTLLKYLGTSSIGIHTMQDEHFGIGVVEYMAAGLIPLAHKSGGPLLDIVADGCGFLANDVAEYAQLLHQILSMSQESQVQMRRRAREYVRSRFADAVFRRKWIGALQYVLSDGDSGQHAVEDAEPRKDS
ncbi:glycosyltransferase family 4 protein [Gaertneriomyces semiglobifer]|nr:glycosyltransferase family 4 protein [Gaertneriomyces semiglobifer]